MVPMVVPGCDGDGWADDAVPGRFNEEEERGTVMEAHTENTKEGARWRRTWTRSEHRRVCDREMKGL
jgi:hypothetical protein